MESQPLHHPNIRRVSITIKQGHTRILAARQRLLDVRGERIEQLLRLRTYLRTLLGEFVTNVDPVSGQRLAEVSAEGSKATGDMSVIFAIFEGTKLRFSVDNLGRFSATTTPVELMADIGRLVGLRVSADAARAEFDYEPVGQPGVRKVGDVAKLVALVIERAAISVESDIVDAPQREVSFAGRSAENGRATAAPAR
jgi:hypothetical protein